MAKKRRKKSSKCPEPFNFLIDLAAGATMNAIANKMEEKHHYRKRGVPNPYRASAIGFSMGKLNKTEDIIKLGGLMGAMGAFDPDDTDSSYSKKPPRTYRYQTDTYWEYDNIGSNASVKNNNKYAWRMNCEDGSAYGISPLDFETRESYNAALKKRKSESAIEAHKTDTENSYTSVANSDVEQQVDKSVKYVIYRVSRLDNGQNDYYRSNSKQYSVGDTVSVPTKDGTANAIIIAVKEYDYSSLPKALEETEYFLD